MSKYKVVEKKQRFILPTKKHYKYIATRKARLVAGGNAIRPLKAPYTKLWLLINVWFNQRVCANFYDIDW